VKKGIFLLIAVAMEDGVVDFTEVRTMLQQYKEKKLKLPKNPYQREILRLAMQLTLILGGSPQERQTVCLALVVDKLYELDKASKKAGFGGSTQLQLLSTHIDYEIYSK
jgi:hypothetical protein